jgi:hypothetical protein
MGVVIAALAAQVAGEDLEEGWVEVVDQRPRLRGEHARVHVRGAGAEEQPGGPGHRA